MGENTRIEWCDHTFNPWVGCSRISPACDNCYAQRIAERYRMNCFGDERRRITSEKNWKQPLLWNRQAQAAGRRQSVFCGSMCDVFEIRPELVEARGRLRELITRTPWLDWLLLTKRAENVARCFSDHYTYRFISSHVYLGITAENQEMLDLRMRAVPDRVSPLFLSIEPLLRPIDITPYLHRIDGVIVGGETGAGARPMHPQWARDLRFQCVANQIPFFFKQWGEWGGGGVNMHDGTRMHREFCIFQEWAIKADRWNKLGGMRIDLLGRECRIGYHFKHATYPIAIVCRLGKGMTGRALDGETWDQLPWSVTTKADREEEAAAAGTGG